MRRITTAAAAAASLLLLTVLAACAPDPAPTTPASTPPAVAEQTGTPTPTTTPTAAPAVALPTDCRAIVSAAVLAQLQDQPLNDKAFGPTGVQSDGSLICVWGSPSADTTNLTTTISYIDRGPALDAMNAFREKGATCYTPDEGTRCERTWKNKQYPVTDGRTMFWRDGVMIDTQYSNLAPDGYTASLVAHIFG
ncbi:hypothetical protein [Microbacterium sp. KR10-403]|uniref:hypothetical protein n=1 Tax=Microbacterium sp. KR10-403 TaxID=3158581 RepID=UPI0032E3A033